MDKVIRVQKSIALPEELIKEIEERSRRERRSFSNMAEVILEEALKAEETQVTSDVSDRTPTRV